MLSNDTAAVTLIDMGGGDDEIVVGTVPLIPDPGNRTLEFPEGVPVADTQNMTNGNSRPLFVLGDGQNDRFEVNHNRGKLYLHGGAGDDRFLLKTFLVLKENPDNPDEITNLAHLFGGTGTNRYDYLQNGPVVHQRRPRHRHDRPRRHADRRHLRRHRHVRRRRRPRSSPSRGIEAVEVDGGGGNDEIYVLLDRRRASRPSSTAARATTRSTSAATPPPLVFDPPAFTYTPPAFEVPLPPTLQFVYETRPFGNFSMILRALLLVGHLAALLRDHDGC